MRWVAALGLAVACGGAFGQSNNQFSPDFKPENLYYGPSESERDWQEQEVKMPDFPQAGNLIEFEVVANSFRFYVDRQSIVAGRDGVVRYTLVARSNAGAESISYNGLRCKSNSHRVYATGRSDGTWAVVRDSDWKELQPKTISRQHQVLMRDFFCPAKMPITTREEGIDALRRGIHPQAVSNQPAFGRP